MTKKPRRIDGIIPRGTRPTIDNFRASKSRSKKPQPKLDSLHSDERLAMKEDLHQAEDHFEVSFDDFDQEEKDQIDQSRRRWWQRRKKDKPKKSFFRRAFKRIFLFSAFAVFSFVAFVGVRAFLAANNIIDRSGSCPVILCGDADVSALQGEGDGRVNILLIGIGGEGHQGGDLADTIIVASIDPIAKEAAMLSIPRDLYLSIPDYGSSRVNAAHAFGEQYGYQKEGYPDGGVGLLQETVEDALDIPIHYYLRVDFEAFRQAVDNVGGVDVTLEEALYDPTFWWEFGVLDLAAGDHKLDGTEALMFVRSRKTSARGDFARSDRQRDVILSLKDKILSLGTFSDPRKIVGLIDTFGNNVRTNIQLSEMVRLYEISEEISTDKIVSSGLGDEGANFLLGASIDGASVLVPAAGDFSDIQKYVRSIFIDGFIRDEQAQISVLNGTPVPGLATVSAEELESYGYIISQIELAPTSDYEQTVIYDMSDGTKPFTKHLLEKRFDTEMRSSSFAPDGLNAEGLDFIIIVGQDRAQ